MTKRKPAAGIAGQITATVVDASRGAADAAAGLITAGASIATTAMTGVVDTAASMAAGATDLASSLVGTRRRATPVHKAAKKAASVTSAQKAGDKRKPGRTSARPASRKRGAK
jgi:hypothetical protein